MAGLCSITSMADLPSTSVAVGVPYCLGTFVYLELICDSEVNWCLELVMLMFIVFLLFPVIVYRISSACTVTGNGNVHPDGSAGISSGYLATVCRACRSRRKSRSARVCGACHRVLDRVLDSEYIRSRVLYVNVPIAHELPRSVTVITLFILRANRRYPSASDVHVRH